MSPRWLPNTLEPSRGRNSGRGSAYKMSESRSVGQEGPPEDLERPANVVFSFNDTTERLRDTYGSLKSYISTLSADLETNLQEKDRIKNHLKNILESVSCGILVADMDGVVTTVNRAVGAIWECEPLELLSQPLTGVFEKLDNWEGPRPIDLQERDWSTPAECSLQRAGSHHRRYLLISLCPLYDGARRRNGTVAILEEVTRLKRLEKQVQRANQLSAMGEMVAALAHEIRNPLGSIELHASFTERLLEEAPDEPAWGENLEHILRGVRSLNLIVSNMLLINQEPSSQFAPINVEEHLEETLGFIRPMLEGQAVEAELEVEEGLPFALGDRELLSQLWLNLLVNALQAMPEGGRIKVSARQRPVALGIAEPDGADGSYSPVDVELQIADTGHGIAPKLLKRIFHPFFTTRPKGTGLGLAIAHKIVEIHRGSIDVESEPGRGTAFTVLLPGGLELQNHLLERREENYVGKSAR